MHMYMGMCMNGLNEYVYTHVYVYAWGSMNVYVYTYVYGSVNVYVYLFTEQLV